MKPKRQPIFTRNCASSMPGKVIERPGCFSSTSPRPFDRLNSMKSKIFLSALMVCALAGFGHGVFAEDVKLTANEAAKHIGETATVTDKVEDAHQAQGGNIFLNMGGKHPNETFTVFVAASAAGEFKDVKGYLGKTISVTGKIQDHQGKPEITVKSPSDITVKEDASAAAASSPAASA